MFTEIRQIDYVRNLLELDKELRDSESLASLRRGLEYSGIAGLDEVLKECKKCFIENYTKKKYKWSIIRSWSTKLLPYLLFLPIIISE
jgi:hypothetical protein